MFTGPAVPSALTAQVEAQLITTVGIKKKIHAVNFSSIKPPHKPHNNSGRSPQVVTLADTLEPQTASLVTLKAAGWLSASKLWNNKNCGQRAPLRAPVFPKKQKKKTNDQWTSHMLFVFFLVLVCFTQCVQNNKV